MTAPASAENTSGERAKPSILFVDPRPREFPFRMELTAPPDEPAVLELAPFALGEAVQVRLRSVLQAELVRYPSDVLEFVSQIFIGSKVSMNGAGVGGLHFVGLVFIAAGEQDAGERTDAHVARAFHHEVSHVLMDAHRAKFDATRFRAALPPDFAYDDERPVGERGVNGPEPWITTGTVDDSPSLDLLDKGFLVPWAMSRLDEDFSSYAEVLMRKPELLLETFAPESRVGRKARVVRDFYIAIDPRFEAYFAPKEK